MEGFEAFTVGMVTFGLKLNVDCLLGIPFDRSNSRKSFDFFACRRSVLSACLPALGA